jgi:hypothetical protein
MNNPPASEPIARQAPVPTPQPGLPPDVRERRWILLLAVVTMALTLLPYLIGAALADGRPFMWLGYNLDDSCVYLSWMRQAADGSLRALNLFTTEPQQGMALNPLFLVLGRIAGWTGLPLLAVYHGARLLFGIGLLWLVWQFARLVIADVQARKIGMLLVCFSSGLGWLPFWWTASPIHTPIDKWQPEAITFLSLYLSPLFVFSLALQVAIFSLLFTAERRGKVKYALWAGLCGFLLGLVHSYDVISISAVWIVYLLLNTALPSSTGRRNRNTSEVSDTRHPTPDTRLRAWGYALLAGAITAPSVAYIYLQYKTEAVFRARADVATLSAPLYWVLLGYGLTLVLAVVAVRVLCRPTSKADKAEEETGKRETWTTGTDATRLLIIWAVVNVAVAYLPGAAFQRKMLQGSHFPIALLAGIGVAWLIRTRMSPVFKSSALTVPVVVLLLSLTNSGFVARDLSNYTLNRSQTMQQRPYLEKGEREALEWIRRNTPPGTAIQPLPWLALVEADSRRQVGSYDTSLACFVPGLIHRAVYCGHWGETPSFGEKLAELTRFSLPNTPEEERIALLRKMKVQYLIFSQKRPDDENANRLAPMFRGLTELPPYLLRVYSNEDADVYRIDPKTL